MQQSIQHKSTKVTRFITQTEALPSVAVGASVLTLMGRGGGSRKKKGLDLEAEFGAEAGLPSTGGIVACLLLAALAPFAPSPWSMVLIWNWRVETAD